MIRTRLECLQVWQALFTPLSWFQLISALNSPGKEESPVF